MKTLKYVIPAILIISLISIAQTYNNDTITPYSSGKIDGKIIVPDKKVVKPPIMDYDLQLKKIRTAPLSKETKIGKAGDMLLIIEGGGFLATSLNPVVIIGENRFEETIISEDFKALYVVITKEMQDKLKKSTFEQVEVRNPGKGKATIGYKYENISKSSTDAESVALIYTENGIALKQP